MRGHDLVNEAAPLLAEYIARQRLAKIGYTSSTASLTPVKAEAFVAISSMIDEVEAKIREEERRKQSKRRG